MKLRKCSTSFLPIFVISSLMSLWSPVVVIVNAEAEGNSTNLIEQNETTTVPATWRKSPECNFTPESCRLNVTLCLSPINSTDLTSTNECLFPNCLTTFKSYCKSINTEEEEPTTLTSSEDAEIYTYDGLSPLAIATIVVAAHLPFLLIIVLVYIHYRKTPCLIKTSSIYEHPLCIRICFRRK